MSVEKRLTELREMHEKKLITTAVYEEQQKALLAGGVAKNPDGSSGDFLDTKKNMRVLGSLAAFAAVCAVGIWAFYSASGQEGKDLVNKAASQAGVAARVIPWSDRAESTARQFVEINKQNFANAIQGITHPTGKNPVMSSFSISKFDERIRIELIVDWEGGFLGGKYQTKVAWDIGKTDHIKASVIEDTASIPVEEKNKQELDEHFKSRVYPVFYKDMGG